VFWQVGSSATLGTTTSFGGNILALASITLNTGASLMGRALARTGAVTLDSNNVSQSSCVGACPVIAISPATLPGGTVGVAYSQTLTGSGGTAPYVFTVRSGTLPAGLTLTSAGVLSGTPTTAGSSTVTIRATDANGCFAERTFIIFINAAGCPAITLSPATLPTGFVGLPYNQTLTASGGTAPYVFTVSIGALPALLTLSPTGILSGTPAAQGTSPVTIRATDANACFAERPYSILVIPPLPTLPQVFAILLALGLAGMGYLRLQRHSRMR
jgi:hypothetical protein